MSPFPFRNPIEQGGDGDPPEWTPPDYAKPIEDSADEEWKPPSYATPIKAEAKKEAPFRPIDALTETVKEGFNKATSATSSFLKEHPKIREIGQRFLTGTSPEQEEMLKKQGLSPEVAGPGLMKIPGSEALSQKVRDIGTRTGNYWGGVLGSLASELIPESGFDPRISGAKTPETAKEPTIRRSREIPYRAEGEVPTPEAVKSTRVDNVKQFMKDNPDAKVTDIKKFMDSIESIKPSEIVPKAEEDLRPLPIRSPNLDPNRFQIAEEAPKSTRKSAENLSYDIAREKFNMGRDLPAEKHKLINPYEKRTTTWKPPNYATPIEEPQAARTESGKIAIGADIKSLGKVLGTSLYKGDIAPIATKELLQNSIDAVRHLGSQGDINVLINRGEGTIHVLDNGKGLTRQELESVFTDLGASGKREDVNAAGGFGLAKAAPLLGGDKVEVSSIARDPTTNKLIQHTFSGTPNELLEGVSLKAKEVPEGTSTGTSVKIFVPKNSDYHSASNFVRKLAENSPNVKANIKLHDIREGDPPKTMKDIAERGVPLETKQGTSITKINNPSAETELLEAGNSRRRLSTYMNLHLSNNGMFQGTKPMYFNNEIPNLPSDIIVDIRPKVPEGHTDYPFTANREELRGTVEQQINNYINENIVKPGVGKRLDELKRLYNSMQEITVGKGEYPNMFGRKIAIYDPKGQITPGEMKEITSNPAFHTLSSNIASILDEAMKVAGTPEWKDRLEKIGIIFEEKFHGIHIPNPGNGKSAILVNPFIAIDKMSPDEASANILHTILHEMAHVEPASPGHNESFTIRLGEIYGKFGARRSIEAQDQILKSIADPNTGIYNPEIQKILSTYKTSRGREATTKDLLSGTGIGSRPKGGGETPIPPGDKSDGEGVARSAISKLLSSLEEAKGLSGEQEAINKAERARRFSEFSSVKQGGAAGAAKSLGKLRGEFEKVNPGERLQLNQKETDSLFTLIKGANITPGEKARGYTSLFKLLNGESVPQRNELKILDDVFGSGFADKILELHGGIGAVGIKLSKAANTMKSMENAMSLAAPLRHGIGLIYRKEFGPAFKDMFKFFGNKEYYDTAMQAIEEHPDYLKAREAGLFLSKPGSLMNSEEEFLNSYVGNLPRITGIPQTVGASQRAYGGFLNKLRFDTYKGMTKRAEELGNKLFTEVRDKEGNVSYVPSKEAKAITNFINVFTGRGNLPFGLDKVTNELNIALWSPRMMASRVEMFTNPKLYTSLPKGMRLEGLKSLMAIASLGTVIDTALAYAGAKVSYNILSTDFGKSRFGTHLVDPWGGLQQYVVGTARFLAGKTDSNQPTTRLDIAGRFLKNKESPAASFAHNLLTAKKFTGKSEDPLTAGNFITQYGQKTSIQSEIGKQFVPIFIQDLHDIAVTEPDWSKDIGLDIALAGASLAGMSQDYPEKKQTNLKFRKLK